MLIPDLRVNQVITIEVLDSQNDFGKMPSRIEEILENTIHISMPMKHGKLLLLHDGDKVSIVFSTNKGVFSAFSTVIQRMNDTVPILVVEKPQDFINLSQKREHVRLDISLPVFYVLEDAELLSYMRGLIEGTTHNVSAGGLFFRTTGVLEEGQKLKLKVHLSDKDIMNCNADIRRVHEEKSRDQGIGVGVEYYDIKQNDVDNMYKFIFSKQRDWRKKGLL